MRKIIFLYNTLMMDDPSTARILIEKGTIKKLEEVLKKFKDDQDMTENVRFFWFFFFSSRFVR